MIHIIFTNALVFSKSLANGTRSLIIHDYPHIVKIACDDNEENVSYEKIFPCSCARVAVLKEKYNSNNHVQENHGCSQREESGPDETKGD